MKKTFCLILLASILFSCGKDKTPEAIAYLEEIETWHKNRIESLKSETSWLTLAGLFWLQQGENTFGSATGNDIVFPQKNAPATIGRFNVNGDEVTAEIEKGVTVFQNSTQISSVTMINDMQGGPTILKLGSLSWYIIKRGNRLGVRLKDSEHPNRKNFKGIERFPINSKWRITAKYKPYDSPKTVQVPTVTGMVDDTAPGLLEFTINGKTFTLEPTGDPDGSRFSIMFGDETNAKETYGGGRFLTVDNPGKAGETVLDFNRAYNPPCVFTPYATCPLPRERNKLTIKVTAGEKADPHAH